MPKLDWQRYTIPLVLGIIVTALLSIGFVRQLKHPDNSKSGGSLEQQHSERGFQKDAGVPIVKRPEPPPPDESPNRNDWRGEEDLKSQWEQAKWAKYAALAAIASVVVGLIALWLLKRTLDATWKTVGEAEKATEEAKRAADIAERNAAKTAQIAAASADASRKSADVAERALRGLERPHLFIEVLDITNVRRPLVGKPGIRYRITNYGKTPAVLRSLSISLRYSPEFPLLSTEAIEEEFYDVIGPGDQVRAAPFHDGYRWLHISGSEDMQSFKGQDATLLILHALLRYSDPMDAVHTDSFCMRATPNAGSFRIDESLEPYNWHETTYPKKQQLSGNKTA
jgi:uncharacterized membrane-anchored protein YhcB (DUF1043 family)